MTPTPLIITCPPASDRRATTDLLILRLLSPCSFTQTDRFYTGYRWPSEDVWIVNFTLGSPSKAYPVRCNGKLVSFKRRPEIRIPWIYGAPRTPQVAYGRFVSLDGETWDTSGYNYAPYATLSILPAADRRALARQAKKEAK